ncbi:MAG: TIR domain-containing protein [Saprospiraceae bacterium]|nr:TIR domain-containing protein [Saprospiraceae bacterium]
MAMQKLKGFISYAHDDDPYFKLVKEGLRKHGKHSKLINSDLWHDGKIPLGSLWHEAIQEQVKGCDFAVFLVSANFLSSEYIEEHEFKNFLKRQEQENFLFFPILISPCNFKYWEELAARQFFKPTGVDYGFPHLDSKFTFSHLTQLSVRTGEPTPISEGYYQQYFSDLLEKIEEALKEYQRKKEAEKALPTSKYFQILPISEVKPVDFLETRSFPEQGFRPFYLNRPYIDDLLLYNYQNRKHTIITGKPLAGKTRSIFELCEKKLKEEDILILFPERIDIQIQDFKIPETDLNIIIFFDDFDQFLNIQNLELLVNKALLNPKVWIVSTCRKDRVSIVKSRLIDDFHNFEVHEILYLNEDEQKQLDSNISDRPNKKSDGTIGGYFLPLDIMRNRFESLQPDSLEREIFHACKALRVWGKTEADSSFGKGRIQKYCQKRLEKYYQIERTISPFEWDKAFQHLAQNDLLYEQDGYVLIEELYLDFISISEQKLEKEILQYFPDVINYNKFLYKAPDFEQAQGVLTQMKKEGLRPDEVTFNSLLYKALDFEQAQGVLAQMKKEGLHPDKFTFSSLLSKALDFEQAQEVLAHMKKEGALPTKETFKLLTSKISNYKQLETILILIEEEGIHPDKFIFNLLLSKAPDFEQAQEVLTQMKKNRMPSTRFTFNSLLSKAPNFEQMQEVLAQMKKEGVLPGKKTFKLLLSRTSNFEQALEIWNQMEKEGVLPTKKSFNILLSKASNFEQAEKLLTNMQKEGMLPTISSCYFVLKLQKNNKFTFTSKLLIWLIFRQNQNIEEGVEKLKRAIIRYNFPKNSIIQFLNKELWEQFPNEGIIHYKQLANAVEDKFW